MDQGRRAQSGEGQRKPAHGETIEGDGRRPPALAARPYLDLVSGRHQGQSQVAGQFLDPADVRQVGAGPQDESGHRRSVPSVVPAAIIVGDATGDPVRWATSCSAPSGRRDGAAVEW